MATADEVEMEAEVEAVQAVYADDCVVIDSYPPHLHVQLKPRTADVTSQQVSLILLTRFCLVAEKTRESEKEREGKKLSNLYVIVYSLILELINDTPLLSQ